MPLYLYTKKLYSFVVEGPMGYVKSRRAEIDKIIRHTRNQARHRGKKIATIDPLVSTTRRLYPYLTEREAFEYARTALRVITSKQSRPYTPQPTLLHQYQ